MKSLTDILQEVLDEKNKVKETIRKHNNHGKKVDPETNQSDIEHFNATMATEEKEQELIKEAAKAKKADRCLRIARTRYSKPSAYRSGAIVKCRQGKIWKDLKEEDMVEEKESLHAWFSRRGGSGSSRGWVDCNSKTTVDGKTKYKPCGRQKGEKRSKYPSCRPTPSACKDKGKGKTWGKTK